MNILSTDSYLCRLKFIQDRAIRVYKAGRKAEE